MNKPTKRTPRYTSYPTIQNWKNLSSNDYQKALSTLSPHTPLSIYLHIPFCKKRCLYCGCSVVLNRCKENQEQYVEHLIKEIELIKHYLSNKNNIAELHFGGGSPSLLTNQQLEMLFAIIQKNFSLNQMSDISIEIDPRNTSKEKLSFLKQIGFNRISFGIQDINPKVQKAIKREISLIQIKELCFFARSLNFKTINFDLIYGLPLQTKTTFKKSINEIILLHPDRVALFSYAHIPEQFPHQKAIKEKIPTKKEKINLYNLAHFLFCTNEYIPIGIDHFATKSDSLALALQKKELQRSFQGYSPQSTNNLIGLGITSVGHIDNTYFQNKKKLADYYQNIEQRTLPITKGYALSKDDLIRRWVIHSLMCYFVVDKKLFEKKFDLSFDSYFTKEKKQIKNLISKNIIENNDTSFIILSNHRFATRSIATIFDTFFAA